MSRDIRKELTDYMPRYYADSKVVKSILDPEAVEFEKLSVAMTDVLDQMFISSATWGLDRWEKLAQIPVDHTKTYEQRREVLKARIRGIGTVRIELIKDLAIAYSNGEVEVNEGLVSKNLFPSFTDPAWTQLLGTIEPFSDDPYRARVTTENGGIASSIKIPCEPNTDYCLSVESTELSVRAKLLRADGTSEGWIYAASRTIPVRAFTTTKDAAFLQLELSAGKAGTLSVAHPQLEKGSTRTTFEPGTPPYTILITFTGSMGIPDQLSALQAEIRKLIPAHLSLNYQFRFYLYSQLNASGMTYADLSATGKTYNQLLNKGV
ncbi:putative phage tail protein [Paenibacillus jamilae]|uniref:putative phage tail protein n=1 Tax=Paenibacillus jamilae TaxID=114136 RepID=UPI0007361770|nr:putative phage tail protein [Paenibacillus jamilae]